MYATDLLFTYLYGVTCTFASSKVQVLDVAY